MRLKICGLGAMFMNFASLSEAAPEGHASCIYETVASEKLSEFGKTMLGEEAEAGLDPVFNAAQNACIGQYGWTEIDAANASAYFMNRVARERLAALIRKAGLDASKLDRAYNALLARFKRGEAVASPDHAALRIELQRENFPTDDPEVLRAAIGYAALREQEEKAQRSFIEEAPLKP